jgi:hypothetical protein
MRPLTAMELRTSLVNSSPADAARMTVPGLHEVVWEDREFLGWRDLKAPERGYVVFWRGDEAVGIQLRAADQRMRPGISAYCSLCRTHQPSGQVALFTAPRAGEAGEAGNTLGTYICADLACSLMIRIAPPQQDMQPSPAEIVARRAESLARRLNSFADDVLATR